MKDLFKKHRVPIIVVVSLLAVALVVTVVLIATKPKTVKVAKQDETTTGENTTTDSEENTTTDSGENITNEEWIILFAEKFGLNSYENESPYFEDVKSDSIIFSYVQTMVENNILDTSSDNLNSDKEISQKAALIQLAKMYGDTYIENRFEKDGLTEEDYIKFATENIGIDLTAVETGFTLEEATAAVDKTWEHYLSKEYGSFEKIEYTENVIDLSTNDNYVYENGAVMISSEQEITEGKIILLATKDENKSLVALKVTAVEKDGSNYILDVTEPELEEVIEGMNIEFSELVSFDDFIPAEGVTVVNTDNVSQKNLKSRSEFNGDKSGTVTELQVNFTDNKLKLSSEWEAAHAKFNFSEAQNYVNSTVSGIVPKWKTGYEIVGKVKIKDLILNGGAEFEDGKLGFNVNAGATIDTSLSVKGNVKGVTVNIGTVPVTTNPFSPVKLLVDIYVTFDIEGEIKIEPKITTMASVKKEKGSGVTATGNATTDFSSEVKGGLKVEIGPDVVIEFLGLAELADVYLNVGVGAEAMLMDTDNPTRITFEVYAPTLNAGVGLNKNTLLSKMGTSVKFNIIDRKDAGFKCPWIVTYVLDLVTLSGDVEIGDEPTTEAPTEQATEPPTQPVTEAPTQKPTEAATQAPTQATLPQYELSSQTYDWAGGFGDNCYIVKVNGLYGVVDFNGNVKIPIQYEDYKEVGEDEVEFTLGNNSYIYNAKSFNIIYQYINSELLCSGFNINEEYETYSPDGGNTQFKLSMALSDIGTDCHMYRTYSNGVLIEALKYIDPYMNLVGVCKFINTVTGETILVDNGVSGMWSEIGINHASVYVSENNEGKIVFFSMDYAENCIYMYSISKDGYEKFNVNSHFINFRSLYALSELGIGFYESGWVKFAFKDNKVMFNVNTFEWVNLPSYSSVNRFYGGRGLYVGINTVEGGLYDLVKGNTIVSSGYEWLDFESDKYIRARKNGVTVFIDYNTGQGVKSYENAVPFNSDGIALVDDGVGLCYVDTSFNRVSEYIYTGDYDAFTAKSIKINGKYHLIRQR